ncbi:MAG: GDSL-type esterase/lipase family protein [Flavobacteriales bacterium]|nr:GDSL-type esterase/lipase family protein [Flavobacteriales bacterium]
MTLRFFKPEDLMPSPPLGEEALQVIHTSTDTATLRISDTQSVSQRRWQKAEKGRLQYPEAGPDALEPFFLLLERLSERKNLLGDSVFHILHYGDSQIEGDRISGYLRHRLQGLFGGSGPGLFPALQTIPARNLRQTASENWQRYTLFGPMEQRAPDRRYGLMYARCGYLGDTASIFLSRSSTGYPGVRRAHILTLFYEGGDTLGELEVFDGIKKQVFPLEPRTNRQAQWIQTPVHFGSEGITLNFRGAGIQVFGLALDGGPGLQVDNIPMRGASGTFLRAADSLLLAQHLDLLNTRLIILEFGGNMLPYVQSADEAVKYGRLMERQFRFMRHVAPKAALIVIGPADMAIRHGGQLQTHPWLESLRDALKEATLKAGGAYWDMYAAMGGRNAMLVWAQSTPPLAGPDYIHFTPAGAEKIAGMFTAALVDDFNLWKSRRQP